MELSDEQVVKAAPPNDTIRYHHPYHPIVAQFWPLCFIRRTLILEPTVLAHDQSNPTTGSMVPPNQQHHRASIGNTMDLYGYEGVQCFSSRSEFILQRLDCKLSKHRVSYPSGTTGRGTVSQGRLAAGTCQQQVGWQFSWNYQHFSDSIMPEHLLWTQI